LRVRLQGLGFMFAHLLMRVENPLDRGRTPEEDRGRALPFRRRRESYGVTVDLVVKVQDSEIEDLFVS